MIREKGERGEPPYRCTQLYRFRVLDKIRMDDLQKELGHAPSRHDNKDSIT